MLLKELITRFYIAMLCLSIRYQIITTINQPTIDAKNFIHATTIFILKKLKNTWLYF